MTIRIKILKACMTQKLKFEFQELLEIISQQQQGNTII